MSDDSEKNLQPLLYRAHKGGEYTLNEIRDYMNRLNQGNPNYTPYQVENVEP